jgi:hypothetical protein
MSLRTMSLMAAMIAAFCACPRAPSPAPTHDADGAILATPQTACDRLAALGFTEGLNVHCAVVLGHVVDSGLERFDIDCMTNRASTKEAMCACAGMKSSGECP